MYDSAGGYRPQGEMVTMKRVFAVIIIVLGIIVFLNGLETYFVADFLGNEMKYTGKQIPKSGHSRAEARSSKAVAIIGSLLGIGMAIGGTRLLNQEKRKHINQKRSRDVDADLPPP